MAKPIKKILVGVDGSEEADAAFEYASGMAEALGANITLVVVKHLPEFVAGYMDNKMMAKMDKHYQDIAADAKDECDLASKVCVETKIIEGHPVTAIADFAKENKFDLIVVGSRGLTGLTHWFVGSTAEGLVRAAHCPVLVVRQ
ncbi:MAG: universal stress protein [Deltaproteobacteria bacterium]|nr:universal stress protein [Deltaproteobacteria bacterium]